MFLIFTIFFGCGSVQKNKIVNLDQADQIVIKQKLNEIIELKVKSNPSTGFSWSHNIESFSNLTVINNLTENRNENPNIVGSPMYQKFVIMPKKVGSYELELIYSRSWEKEIKPNKTKKVTLHIY